MGVAEPQQDLSVSVFSLSEIFPDIPLNYIQQVLKSCDFNPDKATEELLNYNIITTPVEEKDKTHVKESDDSMSTTELERCIKHIEFVENVLKMLKLDARYTEMATGIASADNYKLYYTVLDVFKKFNDEVRLEAGEYSKPVSDNDIPKPKRRSKEKPLKKTKRRVQGGYTLINNIPSVEAKLEVSESDDAPVNVDNDDNDVNIQSDVADPKLRELRAIRNSNRILKRMPDVFFTEAMRFFHNDTDQVFYVAACVAPTSPLQEEVKEQSETFGTTLAQQLHLDTDSSSAYRKIKRPHKLQKAKVRPSKESFERMPKNVADYRLLIEQAQKMMNYASSTKHNGVAGFYAREAANRYSAARESYANEQVTLSKSKINEAKRTNKLDLHGFMVNSAVECCRRVLADWWNDEIQSRVYHGDNLRSEKCLRVEDFVLVTGRGLHSSGGKAKIKPAVKKFLHSNGYLFDEDNSYLIVTGRRLR